MMHVRNTAIANLRAWIIKKKSTLGPIVGAVAVFWIISRLRTYAATSSNSTELPSPRFALPYFGNFQHT
ncbi:predicted protein [Lichtheimia corymbifera JMRC:FSU:9682]|uniref:Uncharacterized protein n=1 Tax=Lichtheimia corymbifera JMRC:FSU:9682 TaxID=1263082 RepID=A0A068RV89_9FUNG|nr:predicted protein [Lichtheimia corymbifera JMRC:FSU:9682]